MDDASTATGEQYACPHCGGRVREAFVGEDHTDCTIGEGWYTYAWLCYTCKREFGRWESMYHDWDVGKPSPNLTLNVTDERSIMPLESVTLRQNKGYHYIRYAILGLYLLFFSKSVDWLIDGRVPRFTIGVFGLIVTTMWIIMDIRNYLLWRGDVKVNGSSPGFPIISTFVLLPLAAAAVFWYSCLLPVPWAHLLDKWLPPLTPAAG